MNKTTKNRFVYTQYSLKIYMDCPLKFKKRYVDNLRWEKLPEENNGTEQGRLFHLLAARYFMGVYSDRDPAVQNDKKMNKWINSLVESFPINPCYRYLPEYRLRMNEKELRLEANFDLLVIKDAKLELWDWKTQNIERRIDKLRQEKLKESIQTMVYMTVLAEKGSLITGKKLKPENISMHYWQPEPPGVITTVKYTEQIHQSFKKRISQLICEINEYDFSNFDRVKHKKHCQYCEYNSLCGKA